jgi:molecular chaperone IbpA
MRTYDLSPLYRTSVGFERMSRLFDHALENQKSSYPPYNIAKTGEESYRITLAVAGFALDDLEIVLHNRVLTVKGNSQPQDDDTVEFLHRGIAGRAFERRFNLAAHIEVVGATTDNGLLHIDLKQLVPDELKPRAIAINRQDMLEAK